MKKIAKIRTNWKFFANPIGEENMKDEIDKNFEWFEKNAEIIKKKYKIADDDYIIISQQKYIKKFKDLEQAFYYAEDHCKEQKYNIQMLEDLDPNATNFGALGAF